MQQMDHTHTHIRIHNKHKNSILFVQSIADGGRVCDIWRSVGIAQKKREKLYIWLQKQLQSKQQQQQKLNGSILTYCMLINWFRQSGRKTIECQIERFRLMIKSGFLKHLVSARFSQIAPSETKKMYANQEPVSARTIFDFRLDL